MNIYNIKESALNETSGISFNIYLSGCKGWCGNSCHSQHTWDFNSGSKLIYDELIEYMQSLKEFTFDHICILGGEPLDQDEDELIVLLTHLKKFFPTKPLWLYTHFELEEVNKNLFNYLDYIKTGKYEKDLKPAEEQFGVFLASENQKITKIPHLT